ncbi:MAG: iron-sulfur cluster assembly scaffold protein [Acidobacteria bacterium]|nr:iron-sulfur cluster assembly scaffold protein [Acidobacteriota bacterium]MBV9483524.1 iron-sulfur cluster assembly scaffold protein [Acidobacteriota bacterium]
MFSAQLLDHFQNPRNAGELENADAVAQLENPGCGDVVRLSLKLVDGRSLEVRFKAKGCVAAMACASAVAALAHGKTLREARALSRDDVLKAVGGLSEASVHASYLAIEVLSNALQQLSSS